MDVPFAKLENVLKQIVDILLILILIKPLLAHNNVLNVLLLRFVQSVLPEQIQIPIAIVIVKLDTFQISINRSLIIPPIHLLVFPIRKELHVKQVIHGIHLQYLPIRVNKYVSVFMVQAHVFLKQLLNQSLIKLVTGTLQSIPTQLYRDNVF